jgi:hypothetical protein
VKVVSVIRVSRQQNYYTLFPHLLKSTSIAPLTPRVTPGQTIMEDSTTVRRGGREMDVPVEALVQGDVVVLRMGMRVPADCRIIHTDGLKVRPLNLNLKAVGVVFGGSHGLRMTRSIAQ